MTTEQPRPSVTRAKTVVPWLERTLAHYRAMADGSLKLLDDEERARAFETDARVLIRELVKDWV